MDAIAKIIAPCEITLVLWFFFELGSFLFEINDIRVRGHGVGDWVWRSKVVQGQDVAFFTNGAEQGDEGRELILRDFDVGDELVEDIGVRAV